MKKIFLAIVFACISITALGIPNVSADVNGDLTYKISDGQIEITGCSKSAVKITIPSEIDGIPVTTVGDNSFGDCTNLAKVTIPESVTSIGAGAFLNCSNLLKIAIPDSVKSIGDAAFWDCLNLTEVTVGNRVETIGFDAFSGCKSLEKVNITDIASWCNISFYDNSFSNPLYYAKKLYINGGLAEKIIIPNGVSNIKDRTFINCASLKSVTLPSSVTSIGTKAFSGCSSLTDITVPGSVTSIESAAFSGCNNLAEIIIPDGVKNIAAYTFSGCSSLKSVTIPYDVKDIDDKAFYGCGSIVNIKLPNSLNSIGNYAFGECKSLADVTIPASVTKMGENVFNGCSSLTSVILQDGLNLIPESTFNGCVELKVIVIPASVEYIKKNVFYGCKNLECVFFKGNREYWDNEVLIYGGNDVLQNSRIICDAKKQTYKFVTNCGYMLPDIEDFYVSDKPNPVSDDKEICLEGWYDNPELLGQPVNFPYYGDKTTLYASWKNKTERNFKAAALVGENGSQVSDGSYKYWKFVASKTARYIFLCSNACDLYLFDENGNYLFLDKNSFTYGLISGKTYYIMSIDKFESSILTIYQENFKGTSTAISDEGKKIWVLPVNIENGSKIMVALYNDDKFVGTMLATCNESPIVFYTKKEYSHIKVMTWDFSLFVPCAKAENKIK